MGERTFDTQCNDLSPDMVHRCGLDTGHAGAHENWYGSWINGLWLTRMPPEARV